MKYTQEQEAAINHRGSSLLVSSGAGSGKTMVLAERLLGHIDEGACIDEFLVITYTRAAALELRERIYDKLRERLEKSPGNMHYRRQSMLCRGADIDTIHAFCAKILRENAHNADLPADFRVADENECQIIKNDVLDDVFNRTYDNIDGNRELSELLKFTVEGRDDKKLQETVLDIYSKLISTPDPEGWIQNQIKKEKQCKDINDILQTDFGAYLFNILQGRVEHIYCKMLEILDEMKSHPDFEDAYADCVESAVESLGKLSAAMKKRWDKAAASCVINFGRAKHVKGYDELKAVRTWCRDEMAKITKILNTSSDDHIKDARTISGVNIMLLNLTEDFISSYAAEKKRRSIADFSDLEHMTLSLLYDKKTGVKTGIAKSLSKRFKEIMIDEYQDVNEVQEEIFGALSNNGGNLFMVGDVKQSIYRFRLAEPGIFIRKYKEFDEYDINTGRNETKRAGKPVRINLSKNYRSKAGILNAVNHIFRAVMSETLGELDYTDSEALISGREEKKGKQGIQGVDSKAVEIDILNAAGLGDDEEEESPGLLQIEAGYVAGKIRKLTESGCMIEDKDGQLRKIRYSDIAILARSVKGIAWRYSSALSELGIPSDIPSSENFFKQTEVQAAISLLSVIDNPMQDIELAALLCGPVYGFTSDEMAEIRAAGMNLSYYDALRRSREPDAVSAETACKCKNALAQLDKLRGQMSDYPADRFIWNAFNEVELFKKVIAMKSGGRRKNNLLTLIGLAGQYEKNGFKGLYAFLSYLKYLKENETDISVLQDNGGSSGEENNAVKILSIHKSKGLEFPVVFLVNTSKKHNMTDLYKSFVFHKTLGIGGMITDTAKRIRYTTMARTAIIEKLKSELLSEELRILYVAMTRAREKLVITAAFNNAEKAYEKVRLLADAHGGFSPQALMSQNKIAQWLIAGTIDIKNDDPDIAVNMIDAVEYLRPDDETDDNNADTQGADEGPPDEETLPEFMHSDYIYPFEAAINIPSKLTVTGLKSIGDTDPEAESADWVSAGAGAAEEKAEIRKPVFTYSNAKRSSAERGTIIHEIMKYLDYSKCSNEPDIRNDIERIAKSGYLDADDVKAVEKEIKLIATFFKSDLGIRLMGSGRLTREFKFSLLTDAGRYYPGGGDDKILLQGIIDCFFEDGDGLTVVDFKTDNVGEHNIKERIVKYTPQLAAYSEALERITGKLVKERLIYFFKTGDTVSV